MTDFFARHAFVLLTVGVFIVVVLVSAFRSKKLANNKASQFSMLAGGIAVVLAVVHNSIYGG
jgi:hypothetical protein